MTGRRRAEIVGAGFAGLAAAAALAQRGWSVRVHERAPHLRPGGFGLAVHPNGVHVLRALGAFEEATEGACRIDRRQTRDGNDHVTSEVRFKAPMFRCARRRIVAALAHAAERFGAEIATSSAPRRATPDGTLELADGSLIRADLVVAADGVDSRLRDALGLRLRQHLLGDGATRLIVRRLPGDLDGPEEGLGVENWSGAGGRPGSARRIIRSPLNDEELYVAMSCLAADEAGRRTPLDVASWQRAFPGLAKLIERIQADADWDRVQWARFQVTRLDAWSRGRVAVVGDAAFAMPPNLGQGALCAMMAGHGLAVALDDGPGSNGTTDDVPAALRRWEARTRPIIEHTQRMSVLYGRVTNMPPMLRNAALWAFANVGWMRERMTRTSNWVPPGTVPALGAAAA